MIPKPIVEIIYPAGECNCSFSTWINHIWDILNEYKDEIMIESLILDTPRAKELGGRGRSVFVNGEYIAVFNLERKLKDSIGKK